MFDCFYIAKVSNLNFKKSRVSFCFYNAKVSNLNFKMSREFSFAFYNAKVSKLHFKNPRECSFVFTMQMSQSFISEIRESVVLFLQREGLKSSFQKFV